MDPKEAARLIALIAEKHGAKTKMGYDPRTRQELDDMGIMGVAEAALGPIPILPEPDGDKDNVCACTVITPGEMLTLPDNRTGPCAWACGRTVQFRPWVKIPTVCLYCVLERSVEDQ